MSQEISANDLLRKIGAMAVQLDIANAQIEILKQELEALRSLSEQKADAKTIAK